MKIALEYQKIRRVGIIPGCLAGGLLASFIPVLELSVRSEQYQGLLEPPLQTILQADWQMMGMMNMLLVITIACMMYHTEYADHAIRRMTTLPVTEEELYFRKCILLSGMWAIVLVMEMLSLVFCTLHWFGGKNGAYAEFVIDLLQNFGYCFCMMLPVIAISLLVASACRNMWTSLGIDVVCVFLATMIPVKYFALSLFPFALPFQILEGAEEGTIVGYLAAAAVEILLTGAAEMIFLKVRRSFA